MIVDDDETIVPLYRRKKPRPRQATPLSLRRELQANGFTREMFAMDTFARRPILMKPIPRPGLLMAAAFSPRQLEDPDTTALAEHLEECGFSKVPKGMLNDVMMLEAQSNAFSPPAQRLAGLTWDFTPRLDRFLIDYAGAQFIGDSEEEQVQSQLYVERVTRCFFISIVARVMQPGCKVDTMLVLEGAQGAQKSALLRIIALQSEWFSDNLPRDLTLKDAREHLPGNLIIEMAELSQLKSSDIETIKAFLSSQHDKYRPSYGRHTIDWPRQNVFVGTTNAEMYLKDATGNRRFWPIATTAIDLDGAAAVIEQVYAEARAAFETGEHWWLDADTETLARQQQEWRMARDPWFDKTVEVLNLAIPDLNGDKWLSTDDVLTAVDIPTAKRNKAIQARAGSILRQLGGERRQIGGRKNRAWKYHFKTPARGW